MGNETSTEKLIALLKEQLAYMNLQYFEIFKKSDQLMEQNKYLSGQILYNYLKPTFSKHKRSRQAYRLIQYHYCTIFLHYFPT